MMLNRSIAVPVAVLLACFASHAASATQATYRLTVENNWTPEAYPAGYPEGAHFSWLGGGTHDASVLVWELGGVCSPGMERMAETGFTDVLADEIDAAGGTSIQWQHWFCLADGTNPNCGDLAVEFTIDSEAPLLTLASMLGPSPDWFIGVSALPLLEAGEWIESLVIPLALYDGGTEDGLTPIMQNPPTDPLEPIAYITYDAASGLYVPAATPHYLGSFTFELLSVSDGADTDEDGVLDQNDNCTLLANPAQTDADGDGFGNACDADLNQDCGVDFSDLAALKAAFFSADPVADFDESGSVDFGDLALMKQAFFQAPGPSGTANDCDAR